MLPTTPSQPPRRRLAPWLVAVLVVVLVAAGLVSLALRQRDGDGQLRGGPALTAPAPPPEAVAPPGERGVLDELQEQVAELRGLAWKEPLDLRVVPREEMVRRLKEVNARDTKPEQLAAKEATLELLGLIPADVNYAQLLEELLAAVVLGFYDPVTKELYVAGGELDAPTKATIVHEMAHALIDQHFGYGPELLALEQADRSDELAAYTALVEGDAVLLQLLWMEHHLDADEALAALFDGVEGAGEVLSRVPEYVQQALRFPYDGGLAFVEELHRAGGFAAVDAAYRNPPTSTEHILHPASYSAGERASAPPLPDLAAATGCQGVRAGALGEFDMRQVLDQHISVTDAARAAEGWNGDSYTVVRCGNVLGMTDRWTTDRDGDADRLVEALERWARLWSRGRAPGPDGRFSGSSGAGRITRDGDRVELVLAQDTATADRLVRALG